MVRLFCFASRNLENINRGVQARKWAVATVSASAMRGRETKAEKYMKVGDVGLLYCNPLHSFTVPFVVKSKADPSTVVTDIWPEAWVLPFSIEPLGSAQKRMNKDIVRGVWGLFQRLPWKGSVSGTLNFTGATTFVPTQIIEEEWQEIIRDLGS